MRSRNTLLVDFVILALVATSLTFVARRVFPVWDDATVWEISQSGEPDALYNSHRDRPLIGRCWQWLAYHNLLWTTAPIFHGLTWFAYGTVTYLLWATLYSERRELAVVAGLAVLFPVVVQTQFVMLNPILGGLIGPTLCGFGGLLLLRSTDNSAARVAQWVCGCALIFVAGLFSEYSIPTALAFAVLILARPTFSASKSTARFAAAIVLGTAAASYFLYHATADAVARQGVRPESLKLNELVWRLSVFPFRVLSTTWQAIAGRWLAAAGNVDVTGKATVIAAAASVIASLMVALAVFRCTNYEALRPYKFDRRFWTLLVAVLLGVSPVLMMGRMPVFTDRFTSRTWLPILPLAACATVALLCRIDRHKVPFFGILALVFTGNFTLVVESQTAVAERRRVADWSREIGPIDADANTVVIFQTAAGIFAEEPRDYELTVRLREQLPPELREQFWAFPTAAAAAEFVDLNSGRVRTDARANDTFARDIRYLFKDSRPLILKWACVDSEGRLRVVEFTVIAEPPLPNE